MSLSWNRTDDDVLPVGHLIAQVIVSMSCWVLGALVALVVYRVGKLFI